MNTFVNFANPNQAATNKVVGHKPEITTLAVGEEGGVSHAAPGENGQGVNPNLRKPAPDITTKALGEEGGQATTLALGEEGGEPPAPPAPRTNGFDQATRDFIGFLRDADTLQGRVQGNGSLTRDEASNQLNVYAQQLQTLKTLQLLMESLNLNASSRVQTVYDQIADRYEAGNKLSAFFDLFARKTGTAAAVEETDIRSVAFRDGEKRDVSIEDLLLSLLY